LAGIALDVGNKLFICQEHNYVIALLNKVIVGNHHIVTTHNGANNGSGGSLISSIERPTTRMLFHHHVRRLQWLPRRHGVVKKRRQYQLYVRG
jgi:hypothetical protein